MKHYETCASRAGGPCDCPVQQEHREKQEAHEREMIAALGYGQFQGVTIVADESAPAGSIDLKPAMPDQFKVPFAEDIHGIWHVRRDDFWDNDIKARVRAHAACGEDIWSCHVSQWPPILTDKRARHCRGCFPIGRKSRVAAARSTHTEETK